MEVKESYAALAAYNRWMNRKLYAAAAGLTVEQRRRNLGAFFGSLHGSCSAIGPGSGA